MSRVFALALLAASPLILLELRRAIPVLAGLDEHAPDPFVAAVAFAALRATPMSACAFAAACGLLVDLPAATPFGLGGARLALVAAVLSTLRRQLDTGPLAVRVFAVVAGG